MMRPWNGKIVKDTIDALELCQKHNLTIVFATDEEKKAMGLKADFVRLKVNSWTTYEENSLIEAVNKYKQEYSYRFNDELKEDNYGQYHG